MSFRLRVKKWLAPPRGSGVRDLIAFFCLMQGTRVLPFVLGKPVNLLPSEVYGVFMLVLGAGLLISRRCVRRASYVGRGLAILAACLWLLLAFDVRGAWLSVGMATLIAIACVNEARYREC